MISEPTLQLPASLALDVACGTGRLLIPWLRGGLDVEGCDISADMLGLCREKAARQGFAPRLYQQAMHELNLPRKYQTIVVCGAFGLGGTREQDVAALRCMHKHLHPGGVLLLDNYLPYSDAKQWQYWPKDNRQQLPEPLPESVGRRLAADGTEYELHARIMSLDPIQQRITLCMRAALWRDGRRGAEEQYTLHENLYFANELRMMLQQTGFEVIGVQGGYTDANAAPEHDVIVFIARR